MTATHPCVCECVSVRGRSLCSKIVPLCDEEEVILWRRTARREAEGGAAALETAAGSGSHRRHTHTHAHALGMSSVGFHPFVLTSFCPNFSTFTGARFRTVCARRGGAYGWVPGGRGYPWISHQLITGLKCRGLGLWEEAR